MSPFHYQFASGKFSTKLALISFGLGTILFVIYLFIPNDMRIIIFGLYFVLAAFIINLLTLLYLMYCYLALHKHREYFLIKIMILVANIPIAYLYFLIVSQQINLY